jgi:hypothetical protein
MSSKRTTTQTAPAPNIDGSPLEIFKVDGTVVLCARDEDGNITKEYPAASITLYKKHLPGQDDPVFDFEGRAREVQEAHEAQRYALDRRLEELRARAGVAPEPSA